jgi:hypothetical protein
VCPAPPFAWLPFRDASRPLADVLADIDGWLGAGPGSFGGGFVRGIWLDGVAPGSNSLVSQADRGARWAFSYMEARGQLQLSVNSAYCAGRTAHRRCGRASGLGATCRGPILSLMCRLLGTLTSLACAFGLQQAYFQAIASRVKDRYKKLLAVSGPGAANASQGCAWLKRVGVGRQSAGRMHPYGCRGLGSCIVTLVQVAGPCLSIEAGCAMYTKVMTPKQACGPT